MDLEQDRKHDSLPAGSKFYEQILTLPKPALICGVLVFGTLLSSVALNSIIYFSLRARTQTLQDSLEHYLEPEKKAFDGQAVNGKEVSIFNNIVMIEVQYGSFNKLMPWQTVRATFQPGLELVREASSSGLILEKGLILTCAYVAIDSIMITVQRQGESKRYPASIVTVAKDLNLALITVTDKDFWAENDVVVKIPSATQIMGLSTAVTIAGFPVGADNSISKLESRVARIEAAATASVGRYGSFPRSVLTLYPSVGKDLTVGPVFSSHSGTLEGFIAQDGSVVPVKTISALVESYKRDKKWSGLGTLGVLLRPMQADALRKYWDLPDDGIGVQIRSVCKDSPLHDHQITKGDILREIDGEPILSNGAIIYKKSKDHQLALPFQVLLGEKKPGDLTQLTIFRSTPRSGKTNSSAGNTGELGYQYEKSFKVTVEMKALPALVPRSMDEEGMQQPKYFILGGLVWTVLTEGLLAASQALQQPLVPPAVQAYAFHRWREDPDEELVVLLTMLKHPCNKFYDFQGTQILRYFNGKEVHNMKQFVQMAGEELGGKADLLQFAFRPLNDEDLAGGRDDPDIVLDVGLCTGADAQILNMHQIVTPFSQDLEQDYMGAKLHVFAGGQFRKNSSQSVDNVMPLPTREAEKKKESAFDHSPNRSDTPEESNSNEAQKLIHNIPWFNVVQIKLVAADQDFISPWKTMPSGASRCSAIIVDQDKRQILTNSHCVANAKTIDVLREDAEDPVPARVVEIAHDVDLAWITTDEAKFWENPKIKRKVSMSAGPPSIASGVRVVGYPTGGSSITITQGIVSRIDGQVYPNGLMPSARNTPDNLLIVQVDAAINPGNSGGPVFDTDGNLLGLAFAGLQGAQNTGYVIPNVHCTNFIRSVEERGRWQAQPESGAIFRPVQNIGFRKFLGLAEDETGVQVRSVSKKSPLWKAGVRKGDVLLVIAGLKIGGDGLVSREINGHAVSMPFDTLVTEKAPGEKLTMDFVRPKGAGGKPERIHVDEAFHPIPPLVPRFFDAPKEVAGREHFAAKPTYFMIYGLIFGVFSNPVLQQARQMKIVVPWSLEKRALHTWLEDENDEVVVLLQGLDHPCNMYYDLSTMRALEYFNGKPVKNLKEFMQMALTAEANGEEYMRFTFLSLADADAAGSPTDPDVVLHRDMCAEADLSLMRAFGIASRVSADLQEAAAAALNLPVRGAGAAITQMQQAVDQSLEAEQQDEAHESWKQETDSEQRQDTADPGKALGGNGSDNALGLSDVGSSDAQTRQPMSSLMQAGQATRPMVRSILTPPTQLYNGVQQDPLDISLDSSVASLTSARPWSRSDLLQSASLGHLGTEGLRAQGFGRRKGMRLGIFNKNSAVVLSSEDMEP